MRQGGIYAAFEWIYKPVGARAKIRVDQDARVLLFQWGVGEVYFWRQKASLYPVPFLK